MLDILLIQHAKTGINLLEYRHSSQNTVIYLQVFFQPFNISPQK
ncbi:MAG: hypothetical protein ACFFAS_13900 [Promethearchaeota archaeon]